jgi:hypothetical protein
VEFPGPVLRAATTNRRLNLRHGLLLDGQRLSSFLCYQKSWWDFYFFSWGYLAVGLWMRRIGLQDCEGD